MKGETDIKYYFEEGSVRYKVIDNDARTIAVARCTDCTDELQLPSHVIHDLKKWTVNSICAKAFNGCDNLVSIIIPATVSIGDEAFFRCTSLAQITIPASVTSIGEAAFWGCDSVASIKSIAETPPIAENDIFDERTLKDVTLRVPQESLRKYRDVDPWRNFFVIEGM